MLRARIVLLQRRQFLTRPRWVELEYRRGGTLAYLAAYDVHHTKVIGKVRADHRAQRHGRGGLGF